MNRFHTMIAALGLSLFAISAQAQVAGTISEASDRIIGHRYSGLSNFNINGHEYLGGSMIGDTKIGIEIHRNFRTNEYTLIVSKEVGRSGNHAIWEVTDFAKLASGPEDFLSQECKRGQSMDPHVVGVIRQGDPVVSSGPDGQPFTTARSSVRITEAGLANSLSGTGQNPGSSDISVTCADEGWGV